MDVGGVLPKAARVLLLLLLLLRGCDVDNDTAEEEIVDVVVVGGAARVKSVRVPSAEVLAAVPRRRPRSPGGRGARRFPAARLRFGSRSSRA